MKSQKLKRKAVVSLTLLVFAGLFLYFYLYQYMVHTDHTYDNGITVSTMRPVTRADAWLIFLTALTAIAGAVSTVYYTIKLWLVRKKTL
ncbi:MAG: hypothetical protein JXR71_01950 [Bacteroidales bacterium]|nr:hypothetical protein [Bacteroidales bacterium]